MMRIIWTLRYMQLVLLFECLIFVVFEFNSIYFQGKRSYDLYISDTLDLLREKGLTIVSEGDEAVFIEGRKLPLVYLTALRLVYLR